VLQGQTEIPSDKDRERPQFDTDTNLTEFFDMADARQRGFLTAGTWCLDRNREVDRWPPEDSVATARTINQQGGGSACNFAVAMKKLDSTIPVSTIGMVGDDAAGRLLTNEAAESGLDYRQLCVASSASTHVVDAFLSKASGQRTHISEIGASALLSPDHFDFDATSAQFLHLGLPGLHPLMDRPWKDKSSGWLAVLRAARRNGLKTNLELCTLPAPVLRDLVLPCLPQLDFLIVNDREIGALVEREINILDGASLAAARLAATDVLRLGAMRLVVVHFPLGALAICMDREALFVPSVAIPSNLIAGPNGAGDAFAAGLLYGLHEDWALDEAVWLGHAAAACSLTEIGTTSGVRPWKACLQSAVTWGKRQSL
jgi:sugar/nucleoside kinase (ribokinase family)